MKGKKIVFCENVNNLINCLIVDCMYYYRSVEEIDEDNLKTLNAYLLFYEQLLPVDESSTAIATKNEAVPSEVGANEPVASKFQQCF